MEQKPQSAHLTHFDVGNDARGPGKSIRPKKLLSTLIAFRLVSVGSEKIYERFHNPEIVINYSDRASLHAHLNPRLSTKSTDLAKTVCYIFQLGPTGGSRFSLPAIFTKVAKESASIFRIICPRCICTVYSVIPNSPATCLFNMPLTKSGNTCCSLGVKDSYRASKLARSSASFRLSRSCSSARSMHVNSAASSIGFVRKSTAPPFIALTVDGMSPRPVMKMTGIVVWAAIDSWTCSPFNPGILKSRIRHAQASWRSKSRKS